MEIPPWGQCKGRKARCEHSLCSPGNHGKGTLGFRPHHAQGTLSTPVLTTFPLPPPTCPLKWNVAENHLTVMSSKEPASSVDEGE